MSYCGFQSATAFGGAERLALEGLVTVAGIAKPAMSQTLVSAAEPMEGEWPTNTTLMKAEIRAI